MFTNMYQLMNKKLYALDEKDFQIIKQLTKNSRISIRELAKTVEMKPSSVFNRLKRIENTGIIRRYTIELNHEALGKCVMAYVFIRYDPLSKREQTEIAREILKIENCESVLIITGEWDMIALVRTKDVPTLSKIILDRIRKVEGVAHTLSVIVLKEMKKSDHL